MNETILEPQLIVTRHKAMVDWLFEIAGGGRWTQGKNCRVRLPAGVEVLSHAAERDLANRNLIVIGALPERLASLCKLMIVPTLYTPPDERGKELSLEAVRRYSGPMVCYQIREWDGHDQ